MIEESLRFANLLPKIKSGAITEETALGKKLLNQDGKLLAKIFQQTDNDQASILMQAIYTARTKTSCPQLGFFIELFKKLSQEDQAQLLQQNILSTNPLLFDGCFSLLSFVAYYTPEYLDELLSIMQKLPLRDQCQIWQATRLANGCNIFTFITKYDIYPSKATLDQVFEKLLKAISTLPSTTKMMLLTNTILLYPRNLSIPNQFSLITLLHEVKPLKVFLNFITAANDDETKGILVALLHNRGSQYNGLMYFADAKDYSILLLLCNAIVDPYYTHAKTSLFSQVNLSSNNLLGILLKSFSNPESRPVDTKDTLSQMLTVIEPIPLKSKEDIFLKKDENSKNILQIATDKCPELLPILIQELITFSSDAQKEVVENFGQRHWNLLIKEMIKTEKGKSDLIKFALAASSSVIDLIRVEAPYLLTNDSLITVYDSVENEDIKQAIETLFRNHMADPKLTQLELKSALLAFVLTKFSSQGQPLKELMATIANTDELNIDNLSHLLCKLFKHTFNFIQAEKLYNWQQTIKLQLEFLSSEKKYPEALMALALMTTDKEQQGYVEQLKKLTPKVGFLFKTDPIVAALINQTSLQEKDDPRDVIPFIDEFKQEINEIVGGKAPGANRMQSETDQKMVKLKN